MTPSLLAAAVMGWVGAAVVLSEIRCFRHRNLLSRLAAYQTHPGAWRRDASMSLESMRDVFGPLLAATGEAIARAVGIRDPLGVRLARVRDRRTVVDFRLHQAAWSALAFGASITVALLFDAPAGITAIMAVTFPLLTFLVIEQRVTHTSHQHRTRIERELPVVAEQLAMLLQAGYSLTGAVVRLAERGTGTISGDLAGVAGRVRQGLTAIDALEEWAALMDVEPLHRVVAVCALDREMSDVGPLMSDEARAIRQQAQRRLVEQIERRNEQVWIPVTVATLVPGVILLSIPFVDALRTFSVGP